MSYNKEILDYNTEREKLNMPEYGRNVLKMVEMLKDIPEKSRRSTQAAAIVRVMRALNPGVLAEENWEQRLWDHLFILAGHDLDVDSPYPVPSPEAMSEKPMSIPLKNKPIKAYHYGRNIESVIDLVAAEPEGETKTALIRQLAIYMRQQYLIWNKDNVADETIFQDIEKLSDYRLKVPEDLSLSKISADASFAKPGMNLDFVQRRQNQPKRNNFPQRKGKQKNR